MTSQPFDHGELNLPLAKRQKGYLARLERESKTALHAAQCRERALRLADRAKTKEALQLIAGLSDERLRALGAPHGLTVARETRLKLESAARRWPDAALTAMAKEGSEA